VRDDVLDAMLGLPESHEVPFDALMPHRVNHLLLVTSLYDCYTFIEDGHLSEMLLAEYLEHNLRFTPYIQRVSSAEEALRRVRGESFDLVISMPRVGDMNVRAFAQALHETAPHLPLVLLASNFRELAQLQHLEGLAGIAQVFVWLGDVHLFLAIIKTVEDRANAWHDARIAGVKSLLLVEDSVQFYSSYLPMLYTEIFKQTDALTQSGPGRVHRGFRHRARPKVLLATRFEEAVSLFERYKDDLLGVILDASFPREGRLDRGAGHAFAALVRERMPAMPLVMQSGSDHATLAQDLGVGFIDKRSRSLLQDLRTFMQNHLGFGDFVFRRPGGDIASKAADLRSLEWALQAVPADCLSHTALAAELGQWLRARAEFELAEAVAGLPWEGPEEGTREALLDLLRRHRERAGEGVVTEFSPSRFEASSRFVRIGTGSLGGKGRGLAFVNSLITTYGLGTRFPGVRIAVPPTAVLATSVFDRYMAASGLLPFALEETDDARITHAFLAASLPKDVVEALWNFLTWVRYPLAVRSSSLLEDASYQPFAGIYETYMIPNNAEDPETRLEELCKAIRMVYASTYHSDAKAYIESTPNRLEEEKMAVVIQQVAGRPHDGYHYPHFAGVGRTLNFYPLSGMRPEDGIASVALGLGKTVVDGGRCVRFSPAHPRRPLQSLSVEDHLENSQREFLALDLGRTTIATGPPIPKLDLASLDLETARRHGTLAPVASIYSPDDDAIYDGLSRPGIPLVTLAGVLKGRAFPLPEVLAFLLKVGTAASSCPVEIEFAVTLSPSGDSPHDFSFLQMRPLVLGTDAQDIQVEGLDPADTLALSGRALGNGLIPEIRDIVYVRREGFDRAHTPAIATEVGRMNGLLREAGRPYLLLGPGRWGSSDPWLGIPVKWAQISGVRCILETNLADMHVDPSQGSHFFQNLMSFGIGYLTLDTRDPEDHLDMDWLDALPAAEETAHLRHVVLAEPLLVALNGRRNRGAVLKPGISLG
jgi:hypothetical protein